MCIVAIATILLHKMPSAVKEMKINAIITVLILKRNPFAEKCNFCLFPKHGLGFKL